MSDAAPLPAPHLQIFHSFVEALAKVPDIGGSARSVIESWLLEIEEDESTAPAKIQDQCQSFQCFNIQATTDKVRLQIAMTTGTLRSAILNAVHNLSGIRVSSGPAPRGYLEEELADWIGVLHSK